jgi:hypothetical protein
MRRARRLAPAAFLALLLGAAGGIALFSGVSGVSGAPAVSPPKPPDSPSGPLRALTVRAGKVLDGRGGVLADALVVVEGPRIATVAAAAPGQPPRPADYDLQGLTLLPGGIDTHVHIGWHFDKGGRR